MSLTSLRFLYFLAAVIAVCFIFPRKLRNPILLVASLFFYWSWKPWALAILIFSLGSSYVLALLIEQSRKNAAGGAPSRRAKILFAFSIVLQVTLLCLFKYLTPLELGKLSLVMPLGISFYSFQIIAFLSDVYMGKTKAERNIIDWALFVSFFPKIIEGPIERSGFLAQLKEPPSFRWEVFRLGAVQFLWGLFVKLVIAGRLAAVYGHVDLFYIHMEGYQLLVGMIAYSLQLYTDFSAYTSMASGVARMLGYELSANFAQPYFATGIKDFWRRWHISLSSWLRDYIYIPLGGSRCSRGRKYLNVLVTFLVSGIWHGASWNFIVWGLLHGILQLLEDMLKPLSDRICARLKLDRSSFSHRLLVSVWTFALVSVLWLFFWRESLKSVLDYLIWTCHFKNCLEIFEGGLVRLGLDAGDLFILGVGLTLFTCRSVMAERGVDYKTRLFQKSPWVRMGFYWIQLLLIDFSFNLNVKEFVYAAF